jgi:hypothetical protein
MSKYEPSLYNQNQYPDIQYYTISIIENTDKFLEKFNSFEENKTKYVLINTLLNENCLVNDIKKMKCLNGINNLSNILLKIYNLKISREKAKIRIFKDELENIKDFYNQIYGQKLDIEAFKEFFIKPFIESWEIIKMESCQYKCRILRELEKGEKPLDMNVNLSLYYFLVDDGDSDGHLLILYKFHLPF